MVLPVSEYRAQAGHCQLVGSDVNDEGYMGNKVWGTSQFATLTAPRVMKLEFLGRCTNKDIRANFR